MTHFVADPEPIDYWVPRLQKLAILSASGKAMVNVWRPGMQTPELRVKSGHPRFRYDDMTLSRDVKSGLWRFQVSGLVAGDLLAAFDQDGKQQTAWLPITGVTADKLSMQRTTGKLPASTHKPNVVFDPYGTDLAANPTDGSKWISETEKAIKKILANPIGALVLNAVADNVVIFFDAGSKDVDTQGLRYGDPPQSAIRITPQVYPEKKFPGAHYDEVLLHEFAHMVDRCSGYVDLDGFEFDSKDFFTVTVTNVYASMHGRPLRKDHRGFMPMPGHCVGPAGEVNFNDRQKENLELLQGAISRRLYQQLIFVNAPWNPFG